MTHDMRELLYALYDMKDGFTHTRPVREVEAYLQTSLTEGLKKAQARLARTIERQKYAGSDGAWWSDEVEKEFFEALVALFEGLVAGRTSFPSLPTDEERAKVFGVRGILPWTQEVQRTNPKH